MTRDEVFRKVLTVLCNEFEFEEREVRSVHVVLVLARVGEGVELGVARQPAAVRLLCHDASLRS